MADDYRNTYNGVGTLGSLTDGGSTSGSIDTNGDHDVFAIALVAGRTYDFTLHGIGFADTGLALYNSSGIYQTSTTNFSNAPADLLFTAITSGTYYIDASSAYSSELGSYTLTSIASFVDDYRDDTTATHEAASTLTIGTATSGSIESIADKDVFGVTMTAGVTYTITLDGLTLANKMVTLLNSSGSYLTSQSAFGTNSDAVFTYTPTATGTFFVRVESAYASQLGTYTIKVSDPFVDDFRDTYGDASETLGTVTVGGSTDGKLEIDGDKDVFAVSMVAGSTYTITLAGSGGTPLGDKSLTVFDGNGLYQTNALGSGTNPATLSFTATATGTFYLEAKGLYSSNDKGGYTLSVSSGIVDDYRDSYNDTTETLGSVIPGSSSTGKLEVDGDKDVFAVSVVAGTSYTVTLTGTGGTPLVDKSLALLNASGVYQNSTFGIGNDAATLTFTAQTTGTFYIEAKGAYTTSKGTYTLEVSNGFIDDFRDSINDEAETLGTVTVDGPARSGKLETGGDQDIFAVLLQAGVTYTFSMTPKAGGSLTASSLALYGTLQDFKNNAVASSGNTAQFQFTADATGTYYLKAQSSSGSQVGDYTVRVTDPFFDDYRDLYGDTSEILGHVNAGANVTGRIEIAHDVDVFAVTLTAGKTYTFDLAKQGGSLNTLQFALLDASGVSLVAQAGTSGTAHTQYAIATTGTYYVTAGGNGSATGNYKLSVSAGVNTPDDYRNTYKASGTLGNVAIGHSSTGKLELGGDTDVFKIILKAGQSYTFDLKGSGSSALADPELRLIKSNGTVLLTNDDFNGLSSRLVYTAATSGTYYLDARGHVSTARGGYTISAKTGYDDTPGSKSSTVTTPLDGSKLGFIELRGDHDYFKVTLTAGVHYSFDLTGSSLEGAALTNPLLRLLTSSGAVIHLNDDFNGPNAHIFYTPTATGTFFLDATSHSSTTIGGYKLTASTSVDDVRDSLGDSSGTSVTLAVNASRFGVIESEGDTDFYSVQLTAGQSYTFDLSSYTGAGKALADTELFLFDSTGTQIAFNDDFNSINSRIVYTASETDTFYLDARSYSASDVGVYQISVKQGFDDFADSITDPASPLGTIAASGTRGTIETAGDSDLFKFNIVAGHHYQLEVVGGEAAGQLIDPDLRIFDTRGTMLAYADDTGGSPDPLIDFTATASGVVYANVGGVGVGTGGYTVHLAEIA